MTRSAAIRRCRLVVASGTLERKNGPMTSDWREKLRGSGYRLTPQRELILRAVEELGHATPDEVLARVRQQSSAVNVSTVYRTLEVLEELGLIRHAHLSDRAPTYHSVSDHEHFHLVCRNCHRIVSVDPEVLAALRERLRAEHGFTVDVGHLTVFGRCEDCECHPPASCWTCPAPSPATASTPLWPRTTGRSTSSSARLESGEGFVDLSHRDVIRVAGPDRLTWLHSLTSQFFLDLAAEEVDRCARAQPAGSRRARLLRVRRRRGLPRPHRARARRRRWWSSWTGCAS